MASEANESQSETGTEPDARPLVELGWVLAGTIGEFDVEAVRAARDRVLSHCRETFPEFAWSMPMVSRREALQPGLAEPVRMLEVGVLERDAAHWDFALVVTEQDLHPFEKPFVMGAPAASVNVAAMSTARIDPTSFDDMDQEARQETLARRAAGLALHLFGHLNYLSHSDDPKSFMYEPKSARDFDGMERLSADDVRDLRSTLDEVADLRLEERDSARSKATFYVRAVLNDPSEVVGAVMEMKPWRLPFRLSKLTTPAASTMVVLLITAEAWDLGMSQHPATVAGMSLAALLITSQYILRRQRLLEAFRLLGMGEIRVISHLSTVLAVFIGMLTTYALLFGLTLAASLTLFSEQLVHNWAASLRGEIRLVHHLVLSGFVATLGLVIGALGASFEEQTYFRHVALVDEET